MRALAAALSAYVGSFVGASIAFLVWIGSSVRTPFQISDIRTAFFLCSIFSLPPFIVVGMPYLCAASTVFVGRPRVFLLGGAIFGALAGAALGLILTLPENPSLFFPTVGGVAGFFGSVGWLVAWRYIGHSRS